MPLLSACYAQVLKHKNSFSALSVKMWNVCNFNKK